ncbi:MAG: hypothetical protein JO250_20340 [Armatimonadetes bacterium]|nr:hypothetical protein [Armatimonadota bacterium]
MAVKKAEPEEEKEEVKEYTVQRPPRLKLTAEESLKRTQEFVALRKEKFIASIRKSKS